ncbi:unnamed protein product [Coregonus sp. 'balchen']|nr:unnamed protein product [Coregonus sp. 'balchen']
MRDFYIFLAILLYSGLVSVHERGTYWRKEWTYNFRFPGDTMTQDRFEAIITNRIGFPQTKRNNLPNKAERGDLRWICKGNVLFVKWMDTREVTMCSTVHEAFSGQTVKRKVKEGGVWQNKTEPVPDAVADYNRSMGGVDLSDALIGYYSVHHNTFLFHFVDIAVVNSFLLHKELHKNNPTKPYTQNKLREKLLTEMVSFAKQSEPQPPPRPPPCQNTMVMMPEKTGRTVGDVWMLASPK